MFAHIRRRLTVGYVGILALILLVFGVVVVFTFYLRARQRRRREGDHRLRGGRDRTSA
jgi:heme/copper-type cytochrome/quinol oxidase subunit 2